MLIGLTVVITFSSPQPLVPYHVNLWKLPSALHQLCNDAEVTLEVRLRKSIRFSNSDF